MSFWRGTGLEAGAHSPAVSVETVMERVTETQTGFQRRRPEQRIDEAALRGSMANGPQRVGRRTGGPDPSYGGIVVGEAYRVDQARVARWAFDPADRRSWGQRGTLPLLVDPCRTGSTYAIVFAGPCGFKVSCRMISAD
jgi:type IV secretion system protein VirD4